MDIWNILWPFGIFYGHLGYFMTIWYIFAGFDIMDQEKSGNPACFLQRFHCDRRTDSEFLRSEKAKKMTERSVLWENRQTLLSSIPLCFRQCC
jgi:hypothetical protein